jgi:Spy/CpxP family protein refolding chaperone
MKRFICAAFAAALLIPGPGAINARAHDGAEEGEAGERAAPPPHGMPGKMDARMKEHLGLTDEQSAKLKDAMKANGEAMKPLFRQVRDAMTKLDDKVKDKAPDADIQAALDAVKAAHKAIAAHQEKFHETLASFLTPTQQAKMLLDMAARMRAGRKGPAARGRPGAVLGEGGDKPAPKDDDRDDAPRE